MKRFAVFWDILNNIRAFRRVLERFGKFQSIQESFGFIRQKTLEKSSLFAIRRFPRSPCDPGFQNGQFLGQNFSAFNSYSFTKLSFSFSSISFWGQGHVFGHFYLWPLSDTMYESSHNTMAILVHDTMYENGHYLLWPFSE